METIVQTYNLTKRYRKKLALNNVNMHIERGDIYGFIGRNGAGKTTAMKLMLGLTLPTSGEIELFGSRELNKQRKKIGSLIEAPGLYNNKTAQENMKLFATLYGGSEKQIYDILDFVGLSNALNRNVGGFSLGMRQRLGIALAMLGDPELLVLDEPINGLDPAGIKDVRDVILRLNQEKKVTFIISSHLLDELGKITTRYGIINDGVMVEEIGADELKQRCYSQLKITVDDAQKAVDVLKQTYPDVATAVMGHEITVFDSIARAAQVNALLVQSGVSVSGLSANANGFEDYFISRIGR